MKFHLPILPWEKNALEPTISAETIEWHYNGHHKAYVDKTNEMVEKMGLDDLTLEKIVLNHDGSLYDNAAQAWNHTFYWLGLHPGGKAPSANGNFMAAVTEQFGTMDGLKKQFMECGANLFGSGWTWLITDERGELDFINTHNADNPIRYEASYPLWVCDIWEHAYYVDYRKDRKRYLEGIWRLVNWELAERCFEQKRIPNMTRLMLGQKPDEKGDLTALQII